MSSDSESICPVRLSFEVRPGTLYKYWAKAIEEEITDMWGNMRHYANETSTEGWDEPDPNKIFEMRKGSVDAYKKDIRKFWQKLKEGSTQRQREDRNFWEVIPTYRRACVKFYHDRLLDKVSNIPMGWLHQIRNTLDTESEEMEVFRLIDDDFLKELWEEYGSDKLRRVKCLPTKVESRGGEGVQVE